MAAQLEPLYDAEAMRAIDRWAIEERRVPSLDLMERAGQAVAQAVVEVEPEGLAVVLCGKGNNGGDGLVVARLLQEQGREVRVALLCAADELSGDAAANCQRAVEAGVDPRQVGEGEIDGALDGAQVVVDAIFGTGFAGSPRGVAATAIEAMDACAATVVAVDIASGVDASTGQVEGAAVKAQVTVTFHAQKLGQWIAPGKLHTGELRTAAIGIPECSAEVVAPSAELIGPGVLADVPRRGSTATKFSSGVLCVAGGSTGLTGAVCLACEAAMRSGAGYVRALVPASLDPIFEAQLVEVMTVPLADRDGSLVAEAAPQIFAECERAGACVLGSGLGRGKAALAVARTVVDELEVALLVDADGLFALVDHLELLKNRVQPTVITPHAGELSRLLGVESQAIGDRRLEHLRRAVEETGAVVVLKGDDTLVGAPDGRLAVSRGGAPGLATAGTGDVLAGIIGALLAKGMEPFAAVRAGVFLHTEAARAAADRRGTDGMIASDVVEALPAALG